MTTEVRELETPASVLSFARTRRADADRAEADVLQAAVAFAAMHSVDSIEDAAFFDGYGDQPLPVAGEGAPWVAEFAVTEFAAAVGMSSEAGKFYVGQAMELRYRLPRLWKRVVAGDLAWWKARRIADQTLLLTPDAATFVDRHAAPSAHKMGTTAIHRLVEDAIARFMPEVVEERRLAHADGRHFTVERQEISFDGTSEIHGVLDLADAQDLDDAITGIAAQLKGLGSTESLDVRRSQAAGELARAQMALDLSVVDEGAPRPSRNHPTRTMVLYVHLGRAALEGVGGPARLERGNTQITAGQVREWCHTAGSIVVKPVLDPYDPAAHDPVDSPTVPDRHRELVSIRDRTCVFPWCTRPARRCDADHTVPHNKAGPTCPCNLAPLCRRHHRVKTHGGWSYRTLEPGVYLWTSRHGYQYLRDHHGTQDVSADRRRAPD